MKRLLVKHSWVQVKFRRSIDASQSCTKISVVTYRMFILYIFITIYNFYC